MSQVLQEYFRDKTVLIISPEKWGAMHLSKHHYANELTDHCKKVFFLNPADANLNKPFLINQYNGRQNLFIVSYRPFFPFKLRFQFQFLFNILMRYQVGKLLKALNDPVDIVWCFNRSSYANLNWFKAKTRIYHLVDQVSNDQQVRIGQSATVIFTVSHVILDKLKSISVPKHIINHGLSYYFSKLCDINITKSFDDSRRLMVGYVGNLFLRTLDRKSFKKIVKNNQHVEFHIWGPDKESMSNVGGYDSHEAQDFIRFLNSSSNVVLEGVKSPRELAVSIQDMDAFLVCLDIEKDPNLGSNSHKIMEYLSTGKVIISKTISMYEDDGLIAMTNEGDGLSIIELFSEVIGNIEFYNREELQLRRKEFALNNTYKRQIQRISNILSDQIV